MSSAGRAVLRLRYPITPLTATVVTLALLGALLTALMFALGPSRDATATHGPAVPHIGTVAIDLEPALPAANTCSTVGGGAAGIDGSDITSVLDNVPLNSPFFIDIVVDSVPAPGTSGIGLDFGFNDSIMRVTGVIANPPIPSLLPAGPLYFCDPPVVPFGPVTDPLPDTTSPFRADVGDLSGGPFGGGVDETGPGRVISIQIECTGTGTSFLTLSDLITGGNTTMAILGPELRDPYPVTNELEAIVGCNTEAATSTPTPTAIPEPIVDRVAIDLEPNIPSPHTCNFVSAVTSSLGNIPLNTPFNIDIIAEGVSAPGTSGIGLNFGFDGSVVQVNSVVVTPGIPSIFPPHNLFFCDDPGSAVPFGPITDLVEAGLFRVDVIDLSGTDETGSGRLLTLVLECIGTGTSALTMSDSITGGNSTIGVLGPDPTTNPPNAAGITYPVSVEEEAIIGCGEPVGSTPTPTATPAPTPTPFGQTPTPTAPPTPAPTPTATPTAPPPLTPTPTATATATSTPTPATLPPTGPSSTPSPTQAGANSLAISPPHTEIGVGATASVELVSIPPAESLAVWAIRIAFDPAVVSVDGCTPAAKPPSPPDSESVSACETADKVDGPDDDTVVSLGAVIFLDTLRGLDEETVLATITFSAVGAIGECSDLTINVVFHAGPTGLETNPTTTDGEICIVARAPGTATPTPSPSPSLIPTATPTATPTDTPTPVVTGTPATTLIPPVFVTPTQPTETLAPTSPPVTASASPSATPTPTTPAAPTVEPTDTPAPSATALAATQTPGGLPTSGGPDQSASPMLVLTLGLLFLAVFVVAWRVSVRLELGEVPRWPSARRSGTANRWDWE